MVVWQARWFGPVMARFGKAGMVSRVAVWWGRERQVGNRMAGRARDGKARQVGNGRARTVRPGRFGVECLGRVGFGAVWQVRSVAVR